MTYRIIRNIHLLLGLFFMLFLLMYGISSVQMAHPDWFEMEPTTTEEHLPVQAAETSDPRALAAYLMHNHDLRGEVRNVRERDDGYAFRVVRPGTVHEVSYVRGADDALVQTHTARFMGMLNRIHHIGGVRHDYALLNVWGILVALTSVGLILLGLTGVYMWFASHRKRRRTGAVLLAVSLTSRGGPGSSHQRPVTRIGIPMAPLCTPPNLDGFFDCQAR